MKNLSLIVFGLLFFVANVAVSYGEGEERSQGSPIMPLSEVQKGMAGYGMSVFSGTEPSRFEFEVIGKLENRLPKQSLIIVRLSGQNLEHSGTIAGMSGSPLYINDRMIGAVSYAWGFAKDPIAGVTPIENMLGDLDRDVRTPNQLLARQRAQEVWAPYLVDADLGAALRRLGMAPSPRDERAMTPIAMPLSMPPMEPDLERIYSESFLGSSILPISAGTNNTPAASSSQIPAIVPGGVLGIAFLTGDVSMAGVGTITDVVGDRLIGFGHPMMQVGATDVPMLASEIITVLPNQKLSFKMATSGPVFGQLTGDFQSSVVGDMTRRTKMVPIGIHVHSKELGVDEQYNMEATPMPSFFPLAVVSGFSSAVHHALPHALVFQHKITVSWDLEGIGPGGYSTYVLATHPTTAVRDAVLQPLIHAISNPYQDVAFTRFDVDVEVLPRRNTAKIVQVSLPLAEAPAGEEISVRVHIRPFGETENIVQVIPFTPSRDQVGETLTLDVASGVRLERKELAQHTDLASYMKYLTPVGQHNELALRVRNERITIDTDGVLYPDAPFALKALMPRSNQSPLAHGRTGQVVHKTTLNWLFIGEASIKLKVLPAAE